jgi:hypothetical protein
LAPFCLRNSWVYLVLGLCSVSAALLTEQGVIRIKPCPHIKLGRLALRGLCRDGDLATPNLSVTHLLLPCEIRAFPQLREGEFIPRRPQAPRGTQHWTNFGPPPLLARLQAGPAQAGWQTMELPRLPPPSHRHPACLADEPRGVSSNHLIYLLRALHGTVESRSNRDMSKPPEGESEGNHGCGEGKVEGKHLQPGNGTTRFSGSRPQGLAVFA